MWKGQSNLSGVWLVKRLHNFDRFSKNKTWGHNDWLVWPGNEVGRENEWISKNKGGVGHGKIKGPMMSKHRGMWHMVRERMIKHNKRNHVMKRSWYLPDKHLETGKDRSNSDWSALLIIIRHDDEGIWRNDDMTNWSWWSLSYFSIKRDVVSVLSSNHFSSQQLINHPTNHLLLYPTCQCSTAVPSSLLVDWTRLLGLPQGGLEGTTRLDNR